MEKRTVHLGDRVTRNVVPTNFLMEGTVVYISPRGLFYTVEFENERKERFRESYFFYGPDNYGVKGGE